MSFLVKSLLILFFTSTSALANMDSKGCIDEKDYRAITREFRSFFDRYSRQEKGNCYSTSMNERETFMWNFAGALIFIKEMGQIRPLRAVTGQDITHSALGRGTWWRVLKDSKIKFEISCRNTQLAHLNYISNTAVFCPTQKNSWNWEFMFSTITLAGTILHEAWHQQKWHDLVVNGTQVDSSVEFGGAYALEMQFLTQALLVPTGFRFPTEGDKVAELNSATKRVFDDIITKNLIYNFRISPQFKSAILEKAKEAHRLQ